MSGHGANPIFFNKKNKDWTSRTLANPPSPTSDNISFLPYPPTPPQSGRNMLLLISTIYKLFRYKFWCNCLLFSNKISLTIRMFNNVNPHDLIYFKFRSRFFTSLTMLGLKSKGSISFTIKKI